MPARDDSNIIAFPGSGSDGALCLHIDLVLMPRPVWRRLLVPASYSFWDLHVAIQDAMGWEDRHLHQFTVDDPQTRSRVRIGIPDESGFHGVHEILPGWQHPVAPFLQAGGHPLLYTYDFGDLWQHEVSLEKVLRNDPERRLPVCLAGEGVCPSEDCGGPGACTATGASSFDPQVVQFDDPRARWRQAFGHE